MHTTLTFNLLCHPPPRLPPLSRKSTGYRPPLALASYLLDCRAHAAADESPVQFLRVKMAKKPKYDCLKCPGYCCSYPVIEVKDKDAARIARYFDLTLEKAEKKYFKAAHGYKRVMRRKEDKHFGKICQFFDTEARRCGIYHARPSTCREFPGPDNCGYYDFLKFERGTQEDETFISSTWNIDN
jgi:uncharacterized protein